jgi:RNA-directed DNA polymerase
MTAKVLMPVHRNLVAPLGHKPTDMHTTETVACGRIEPGAAPSLIGASLRDRSLNSANERPTPGTATSTTATSTTTTAAPKAAQLPSADTDLFFLLVQAYMDCRRTKRNSASALAFEANAERNLFELYQELMAGSYQPGRSNCFVVMHPRPREVWAAEFRDRIVHWLLYNHIAPRFHSSFIADSCACIPGRGTLYAAERLETHIRSATSNWRRPSYYLKADLRNFFVSIDKSVLLELLQRRINEPWWMDLAKTILMHDPRQNVDVRGDRLRLAKVPPHKSLFNAPNGYGLPIGNLSSQFFANVLLDQLDQHAKHKIGARRYVRYVDDFVFVHESAQWLNSALESVNAKLGVLRLALNPSKTILQPVDRGVDFVGHVIKPWSRTARKRTVRHALHRIETLPKSDLFATGNSYFGLLRQSPSSHTDRARLANALRRRGHTVKGDLTKTYRTT